MIGWLLILAFIAMFMLKLVGAVALSWWVVCTPLFVLATLWLFAAIVTLGVVVAVGRRWGE